MRQAPTVPIVPGRNLLLGFDRIGRLNSESTEVHRSIDSMFRGNKGFPRVAGFRREERVPAVQGRGGARNPVSRASCAATLGSNVAR